jgi:2-oxo-4-hydroxy-4-carboxy-5-ureidoimidazoline decarboxylase
VSALDLAGLWSQGEGSFVATLSFLFEHSPWVVERAYPQGPFADGEALLAATARVLAQASGEEQLALIRAHPELAGKAAIADALTASSLSEQKSAGLDRLTPEAFARFHALNAAYRDRFAFPFIICVRLHDQASILAAMETRLAHDAEAEIATALAEISNIARLRLADRLAADRAAGPP